MKEISVPYSIGNEVKELTFRFTTNGVVQIVMDSRFHVQAVRYKNQWRVFLNGESELNNADDIHALIQILSDSI